MRHFNFFSCDIVLAKGVLGLFLKNSYSTFLLSSLHQILLPVSNFARITKQNNKNEQTPLDYNLFIAYNGARLTAPE
jgi:hypothetical protein